jgi:hypothetical protein
MQTLVVIFPEDFPVALDGLREHVADHQILQGPRIQPIQRQIEMPLERRRISRQAHEHETAPLEHPYPVERIVGELESFGENLGGGAQQFAL